MPILGLYTKNEVYKLLKREERRVNIIQTHISSKTMDEMKSKFKEEKRSLKEDIKLKDANIGSLNGLVNKLVIEKSKLYDEEIERLKKIQKRTKSIKVKQRCESRILDYKAKLLKGEKQCNQTIL